MRGLKTWAIWIGLQAGLCAGANAGSFDAYIQASEQFDAQIAQSNVLPRLTDEKDAALIATLSDRHRFLDGVQFTQTDLPVLMDVCGRADKTVVRYALFDLAGSGVDKNKPPAENAQIIAAHATKNIIAYQDELSRLQPFLFQCLAAEMPALAEFFAGLKPEEITPVRLDGLAMGRRGLEGTYAGMVTTILTSKESGLTESYLTAILSSLADASPAYASVMPLEQRERIRTMVLNSLLLAPDSLKPYIVTIVHEFEQTTCEGLCKLNLPVKNAL